TAPPVFSSIAALLIRISEFNCCSQMSRSVPPAVAGGSLSAKHPPATAGGTDKACDLLPSTRLNTQSLIILHSLARRFQYSKGAKRQHNRRSEDKRAAGNVRDRYADHRVARLRRVWRSLPGQVSRKAKTKLHDKKRGGNPRRLRQISLSRMSPVRRYNRVSKKHRYRKRTRNVRKQ